MFIFFSVPQAIISSLHASYLSLALVRAQSIYQLTIKATRIICMDNVKRVNEAKEVCLERSKWEAVVYAYPSGKHA